MPGRLVGPGRGGRPSFRRTLIPIVRPSQLEATLRIHHTANEKSCLVAL